MLDCVDVQVVWRWPSSGSRFPVPRWLGLAARPTFLLLLHAAPKTGQPHAMTAMVLRYDALTHEAVICSGWGPTTDWIRNIGSGPH